MICLWWLDDQEPDEMAMEHARGQLEKVYATDVVRAARGGLPATAFDPRRNQTSSAELVRWLAGQKPPEAERVVGVLGADLFIPVLTFVFGEAQLGGTAAVVSTARLHLPGTRLVEARLAKECVHELGHTFGLRHCQDGRCAMSRSASVIEVDTKAAELCRDCRERVAEARERKP